jgi:hypothetical protein
LPANLAIRELAQQRRLLPFPNLDAREKRTRAQAEAVNRRAGDRWR